MTFYAIQIEEVPGFGWQGGPEFDTLIRYLSNARNKRKPRRQAVLHRYVCPFKNIPITAARNIKRVHMGMWGSLHTFLHHDRLDDTASGEVFGTGDGTTTEFQLVKTYAPGAGASYERIITKPDVNGVLGGGVPVAMVDGTPAEATFNAATGVVTFDVAPGVAAELSWSGMHFVCVRFNRDDLPFSIDNKSGTVFITNGTLELIEELSE